MIFVTGATGTVGREVVKQLLDQRRAGAGADARSGEGEDRSARCGDCGDTSKPQTFARSLRGVDALFTVVFGPNMAREEAELARVAKEAGVKHIVKLSALGPSGASGERTGIAALHLAAEKALAASGVAWTIVQPTAFMSNVLFQREPIVRMGKLFSNTVTASCRTFTRATSQP